MLTKWKRPGLRERIEIPIGQGHLMVVLQRVGLIFRTSLGFIRGPLIKFLPGSLRLIMIGFLTLSLKIEKVLAHQTRSQLVESVARSIMVIALLGRTIALGVARIATRLRIAQI